MRRHYVQWKKSTLVNSEKILQLGCIEMKKKTYIKLDSEFKPGCENFECQVAFQWMLRGR